MKRAFCQFIEDQAGCSEEDDFDSKSSIDLSCSSFIDDEIQSLSPWRPMSPMSFASSDPPLFLCDSTPGQTPVLRSLSGSLSPASLTLLGSPLLGSPVISRSPSPQRLPPLTGEPASEFKCNVRKILVTYPRCGKLKELEAGLISEFGQPGTSTSRIQAYAISREKHKDGSFHLHLALEFTKDQTIRGNRMSRLVGSQCNIAKAGRRPFDWINVVKYVCGSVEKKVGEYSEVITYPHDLLDTILKKEALLVNRKERVGHAAQAFKLFVDGKSVLQVLTEIPSLGTQVRSLQALKALIEDEAEEMLCTPKYVLSSVEPIIDHPNTSALVDWFQSNFLSTVARTLRSPALYIHGPPAIGKTTLVQTLQEFFRIYIMTNEKQNVDGWENNKYDLVVFDEFLGQWPVTFMNQFLDGSYMRIQRKCLPSKLKTQNVPVVILSNKPPDAHYQNVDEVIRKAFISRLQVVSFDESLVLPSPYITNYFTFQCAAK